MSRASLPQLLAHLPHNGHGARVFQSRWAAKGLPIPSATSAASACFWEVRKTQATAGTTKVWGILYWKGKRVTPTTAEYEPISGSLKYAWATAMMPPLLNPKGVLPMKKVAPAPVE